jgi:hypothetical protein
VRLREGVKLEGEPIADLGRQWFAALADLRIAHPDPTAEFGVTVHDDSLALWATVRDSRDPAVWRVRQSVHCVKLEHFPGTRLARLFVAGMFIGYMTHECFELVTARGEQPFDPHADPYIANPYNALFRRACPNVLTPETLAAALAPFAESTP